MKKVQRIIIILPDIRSAYNVGSIFRTADAFAIEKIYLLGTTSLPIDRFNRPQKEIAKTALGAEKTIPYEYVNDINKLIKKLRENHFQIIGIEQDKKSIELKKFKTDKDIAIIMGNEVEGISKTILKNVDDIIEINMLGKKESLNVSVTTGIVLHHLRNML